MRVSTFHAHDYAIANLQRRQGELSRTQEQLTSGKRVAKPSDDPAAAARAERALAAMSRSEANQRALEASRSAMQLTETALADANELMQQAREAMMNAGNPSYTDAERGMLVQSLRGLREQLLSIANRADGVGSYLFAGQGSDGPPFVDAPGGVQYQAAAGQAMATSGEPLPLAIDGRHAWLEAVDPATGAPDLSLFDVMDRVITELATPGRSDDAVSTTVRTGIAEMDAVNSHLLAVRSRAGELLNRTDSVESRIADAKLGAQYERSLAEDLDMVQAISDFQNRQTGYDAALKAYSLVQRMTLFQYLNG